MLFWMFYYCCIDGLELFDAGKEENGQLMEDMNLDPVWMFSLEPCSRLGDNRAGRGEMWWNLRLCSENKIARILVENQAFLTAKPKHQLALTERTL
jgi:hypothetical protein